MSYTIVTYWAEGSEYRSTTVDIGTFETFDAALAFARSIGPVQLTDAYAHLDNRGMADDGRTFVELVAI
jgi:hypothetical protein